MNSLKKKIKSIMPERIVYLYSLLQIFPQYTIALYKNKERTYPKVQFYDDKTTVDKIINEGMSMSRYGDGEFMWMAGESHASYQNYSKKFADDLVRSFQNNNPKLLIGIPYGIFDSSECNLQAKMHWEIIKSEFWGRLLQFVDFERTYCNASITRPYIDYRDKKSQKRFDNLKRIWNGRDIVIVEGEKTKLGMGNDLFLNTNSIRRIICPAENAYEKIEEIKKSIRTYVSKDTMMIGALGPTASILAADMTDEGYQFVDIGHVDVEYMWFLHHAILREPIEGKYVNESGEKGCSGFYDSDETYVNSIVAKVL